jgi:hypothetical protein
VDWGASGIRDVNAGLVRTLDAVRVRIKFARTVEMAVRWTFYASVLACVCLTAAKFGLGTPALAAALAAIPLAAAAAALARPASRFDAALALDRAFGLEERVATALETGREAVVRDAERALAGRDPGGAAPVRLPREATLLAFTLPVAAVLALLSMPGLGRAEEDSPLSRGARAQAAALELAAAPEEVKAEVARIAAELRSGDPERIKAALAAAAALEASLERRVLDGAGGPADRALAEALGAARAALGRHVGAAQIVPGVLAEKLNRAEARRVGEKSGRPSEEFVRRAAPAGGAVAATEQKIAGVVQRRDWDPRYDAVVRAYYGVKP